MEEDNVIAFIDEVESRPQASILDEIVFNKDFFDETHLESDVQNWFEQTKPFLTKLKNYAKRKERYEFVDRIDEIITQMK